ncbi:TetR family transcriptional regulator C-terminal domain-containing protein [uncultured Ilyobacter sp.]|uniref:TetR/AcrR family transcriptional regulator n=1 Tax=uncultured Ilyobacter sp. TaxID=544433 RepID=UPI0029F4A13B|nr:TetR family transcriptional regulator C-terminal domain-containing protein [uncultured Ilyobacter sp.]
MKNKKMRKDEIIKASIDLMYLKGYNGTSVKDITDAAGIPKGSFYNYFEDKEQYAIDAIHHYYDNNPVYKIILSTNKDLEPLERIRNFFEQGIQNAVEKELKYGCFIGNLSQEMGDVTESISKAAADITKEIVLQVYKNLLEAHEKGDLKSNVDLKSLASFIISSWQGSLVRMKMSANKTALDDFYTILNEVLLK